MTSEKLIQFIKDPERLNEGSLPLIEEWIEDYPFFQTAHLLRVKNMQNLHHQLDKDVLNLTATYVSDRKVLYYLLHSFHDTEVDELEDYEEPRVHDKEIKESLQENIADTIVRQQEDVSGLEPEHEIELIPGLAIDIRKEYGEGMELEDVDISLTDKEKKHATELLEIVEGESLETEEEDYKEDLSVDADRFTFELEEPESETAKEELPAHKPSTPELQIEQAYDFNKLAASIDQEKTSSKTFSSSLIDKFIQEEPRIVPQNNDTLNEDMSAESIQEHESFFTDTLARIYIKQGNYAKAIFAYEKLSLKYPEKSTYFAGQISKIKELIQKS